MLDALLTFCAGVMWQDLTAYASASDAGVVQSMSTSAVSQSGMANAADVTTFSYQMPGMGSVQQWLVGCTAGHALLLFSLEGTLSSSTAYWTLTTTFPDGVPGQYGWGAAWTFRGSSGVNQVFMAHNGGAGIYEVDLSSIDLVASTVTMRRVTASVSSQNNDGIMCWGSISAPDTWEPVVTPFATCGDVNGPGTSPDPNPVSDEDCGTGYIYDTSAAESACASVPCVVGSGSAADQAVCCTTPPTPTPSPTPAPTVNGEAVVDPFDCEEHTAPMQVVGNITTGGYDIKKIDVSSTEGEYLWIASINLPSLNGVAINPRDGIIYGFATVSSVSYIVRVDDKSQVCL